MRHNFSRRLGISLGLAVPVLALTTGCPGLFPPKSPAAATPSPSPSPGATPASTKPRLILDAIHFDPSGHHTVWIENTKSTAITDIAKYALRYTKDDINFVSLRLNEQTKTLGTLAPGATVSIHVNETGTSTSTDWYPNVNVTGGTAETLSLQAASGSLSLYDNVSGSGDFTATNMSDYVQYGPQMAYSDCANAVDVGLWDSVNAFVTAPGTGSAIGVSTPGATGSANWEKIS